MHNVRDAGKEGKDYTPQLPWNTVSGMGGGSAELLCTFGWSYREDLSEDMNFMVGCSKNSLSLNHYYESMIIIPAI